MKLYTTIQNTIASKLSSADTYRYTCLSFTPRKDGYTDSTFKQISELNSNKPESEETIKDFVGRLRKLKIMTIDEVFIAGKRRNRYYFPECTSNFRMINNTILEADIAIELKGFLIQLFTITLNNTYEINLSMNQICSLIKISLPTARKYLKELEKLQLVTRTEKGLLLTDAYFIIGNNKQNEINKVLEAVKGTDLENRVRNTDMNAINNPALYLRSLQGGYTNLSVDKKLEIETIEI